MLLEREETKGLVICLGCSLLGARGYEWGDSCSLRGHVGITQEEWGYLEGETWAGFGRGFREVWG